MQLCGRCVKERHLMILLERKLYTLHDGINFH